MRLDVHFSGRHAAMPGWFPVVRLAEIAARCLGGDLRLIGPDRPSLLIRRWRRLAPARAGPSPDGDLFIATRPEQVRLFSDHLDSVGRRRFAALWIIDSFHDALPPADRATRRFDLVAYTTSADRARYEGRFGDRALHLGWGADALGLGGWRGARDIDVLRVGRQPESWDDDARSAAACAAAGLRFHGRPAGFADRGEHLRALAATYRRARFVLAHSNLVSRTEATHQSREYITARWTDALACGAVVAGVQPRADPAMESLLWPGATLDFPAPDLAANITDLAAANHGWTQKTARHNHRLALERLDWRWRLREIADRAGMNAPALENELTRLRARVDDMDRGD